jgi:hypothetical protein
MRNRFYPTLSAFHEDPPVGVPPAGLFTKQYLVWAGSPGGPGGSFVVTPGGTSGSAPEDIIQAARIQIVAALALGGVAGYMIGKRRR